MTDDNLIEHMKGLTGKEYLKVGWVIYEQVAISIINPLPLRVFTKPEWMSQDDFEKIANEIESSQDNE